MEKIICYIDMLRRGGAQRVMSNLVTHFVEENKEVILVNDFIRDESLPHYDVPDTVKRLYLRKKRKGLPILKNLIRVVRLRKIIKKEKPDVVLSFLGGPNITTLLASLGLKAKVAVSVRNDPRKEYGEGKINKWFVRLLFRRADGCIFQTEDAAKYFDCNIVKKSAIIYNPVAEQFFKTKWCETPKDIVTFGRFEQQKNHKLLIAAYSMLPDHLKKDRLIIYGEGPLKSEINQFIEQGGLKEKVLTPGNVSDVDKKLSHAKLFVLSSNYEGLPNALMEAMAVGVPCISTDCPCGGPRSLIENSLQGILVPCENATALKEAMVKLLTNPELMKSISCYERERSQVFKPNMIYKQWDEYLNKVISGSEV